MASRSEGKVVDEKAADTGSLGTFGGTSMGTATDVDGKFKLLIPADTATLVVFLYRDEDRDREDSRLKVGRNKGVDDRVAGRGRNWKTWW